MTRVKPRGVARTVQIRFIHTPVRGEPEFREIHVERADGSVRLALDPDNAIAMVRDDDAKLAKRMAKRNEFPVTVVEWLNTPPGFEAPK